MGGINRTLDDGAAMVDIRGPGDEAVETVRRISGPA
jgi:hypothetical protein